MLAAPKERKNYLFFFQTLEELKRSIFNSSKIILKTWEAFSIFRKAFSNREKHFQFFENHSQNVGSIFNFSKSILKS